MFTPFSLVIRGRMLRYERPAVMGIINVTPDSFHAPSRQTAPEDVARKVTEMVASGADIIDIGAYSSRPGADDVSQADELRRLEAGIEAIRRVAPEMPVSVDTFRADVAREAVTGMGGDIINDICGGDADPAMFATVAALKVPYILMHMRGTPATMQTMTDYPAGVVTEVLTELSRKVRELRLLGVNDVIVDPGLGFAKTVGQNYQLLDAIATFREMLDAPVLIGASRKSMICRPLGIRAAEALNGTTVVNTVAIMRGASILRVHDVAECRDAVTLLSNLPSSGFTHS